MRIYRSILLVTFVLVIGIQSLSAASSMAPMVTLSFPVSGDQREALLCRPEGDGPFPAVVFNHGSVVDMYGWPGAASQGYRMDSVCEALAKDGYLAFLPIREKRARGKRHADYEEYYKDVVSRAVDYVKNRPDVDPSRIALMGFSMGGFTSLKVALERQDLRAVILLAPATVRGRLGEEAKRISSISAPILVLAENNDEPHILKGVATLEQALRNHGKESRVIRYNRGGGHTLFYTVGYYWPDVTVFLREKLGKNP